MQISYSNFAKTKTLITETFGTTSWNLHLYTYNSIRMDMKEMSFDTPKHKLKLIKIKISRTFLINQILQLIPDNFYLFTMAENMKRSFRNFVTKDTQR